MMMDENEGGLSRSQQKVVSLLPIFPSLLSTIASCTIIMLAMKTRFKTPYRRILFGLSVADSITSISFTLQAFLVPAETSTRAWAIGNDATCSMIGATTQISLSSLFYCVALSFYFLATIRLGITQEKFAKRYEPWLHAFAAGYPILTATVGASLGAYSEVSVGIGCFLKDYPTGCLGNDEVECHSDTLAWIFGGVFVILCFPTLMVMNSMIYFHVRAELRRGMARSLQRENQTRRIRQVATQAFLYVTAFSGTYIWTTVIRIIESQETMSEQSLYPLLVLQAIGLPSTGIFNLLIFLKPKYDSTRKHHPDASSLWVFRRALYGESIPINQRMSNGTSSEASTAGGRAALMSFRNKVIKSFRLGTAGISGTTSLDSRCDLVMEEGPMADEDKDRVEAAHQVQRDRQRPVVENPMECYEAETGKSKPPQQE